MIMSGLQECNMNTLKTNTRITVKNIGKTKTTQKAKTTITNIKMNI